jgi:hypothetical protein
MHQTETIKIQALSDSPTGPLHDSFLTSIDDYSESQLARSRNERPSERSVKRLLRKRANVGLTPGTTAIKKGKPCITQDSLIALNSAFCLADNFSFPILINGFVSCCIVLGAREKRQLARLDYIEKTFSLLLRLMPFVTFLMIFLSSSLTVRDFLFANFLCLELSDGEGGNSDASPFPHRDFALFDVRFI